MATFGEKTHDALVAAPAVAALVNARVFPARLPQNATLPAIRYSVVSDAPQNTLSESDGGARKARVQVDCFATKYGAAQALADAVAGALGGIVEPGFTSMLLMRRDVYEDEPEPGLHWVSMDFSMWLTGA